MNISYCLPIVRSRSKEVIETIEMNLGAYAYFEVWLDYLEDFSLNFLIQLVRDYGQQLIVVFRRQELKKPQMRPTQRCAALRILHDTDVLVDLDIVTQIAELQYSIDEALQLRIITSYHNYQSTPESKQLHKIIASMSLYKPCIYKIATYCDTKRSALSLMQLLLDIKQENKKAIIIGMGLEGKITRLFGALAGNEIVFAPQNEQDASAPGQLTLADYQQIINKLGH